MGNPMAGPPNPRRQLTEDESLILGYIREIYGGQNSAEYVHFNDADDAVLFVSGSSEPSSDWLTLWCPKGETKLIDPIFRGRGTHKYVFLALRECQRA